MLGGNENPLLHMAHSSLVKITYAQLLGARCLAESAGASIPNAVRAPTEIELQARFYAGEFGECWTTLCGREVRLLHPGEWNREAGPDFRRALLLFDGEERVNGDIEMDGEASGWENHGHATNPDFDNVALHCFFREGRRRCFARTTQHRAVPQVRLGPLPEGTSEGLGKLEADFLPAPVSCIESARNLLALAARHRLQRKAQLLDRSRRLHGPKAALWQALATALGYRRNSIPLTLLAQRVAPRRAAGADGEALLFGLAGFLEGRPQGTPEEGCLSYWQSLWERWWKLRHAELRLILPPSTWAVSGGRPANHPHRRVAALALVAQQLERLMRALDANDKASFGSILTELRHPIFWDQHWHLDGRALAEGQSLALVGQNRLVDILINVWCPWQAAAGDTALAAELEHWEHLKPGQVPRKVRELADWLHPDLQASGLDLRKAITQQALLQLGQDFFGLESPRVLEQRLLTV